MNEAEIKNLVTSYIEQALGGMDKENPKFDFKRSWYDLKKPKDINEFLKDTSSIANTIGPDGFIVIGFDDKRNEFYNSTFKASNLRDSSDLINLINSRVDRLFTINTVDININGNSLSVIHIPPSLDKPHVIRQYIKFDKEGKVKQEEDNKIFVRRNSSSVSASKYDLELMYYDRKNIIPDYLLFGNFHVKASQFGKVNGAITSFATHFTLENTGRRPLAISHIKLIVCEFNPPLEEDMLYLDSGDQYLSSNILIPSGQIWNGRIQLIQDTSRNNKYFNDFFLNKNTKSLYFSPLEIHLANAEIVFTDLKKIL